MSNNKTKVITIYSPSGGGKTIVTSEWQKRISKSSALFFDDRDYDKSESTRCFRPSMVYYPLISVRIVLYPPIKNSGTI